MIDPKELRIGNILKFNGYESVYNGVVTSLGNTRLVLDNTNSIKYNSKQIRPVVLTEELLLKCGFEDLSNDIEKRFRKDFFNWYSSTNSIVLEFDNGISGYDFYTECKCLHQLQNLYWDLVGKELEINL